MIELASTKSDIKAVSIMVFISRVTLVTKTTASLEKGTRIHKVITSQVITSQAIASMTNILAVMHKR